MPENETAQLQRAIFSQYVMMKKLIMELEEEREASATAASAAQSVIRMLQKEKEVERMEAWQYKRIAEEKMTHTDRVLEIVEEVMQHKEVVIYHLRNLLYVYKQRLLGAGIDDCDIADEAIAKTIPLLQRKAVGNLCRSIKRNFSLPILNNLFAKMEIHKNDGDLQLASSRLDGYMCNSSENELEQVSSDGNNFQTLEPKKSLSTEMDRDEKHGEEPRLPSIGISQHSYPLEESSRCSSFLVASHQIDISSKKSVQNGKDAEDTLQCDQLQSMRSDVERDEVAAHSDGDVDTPQNSERSNAPVGSSCTENGIIREHLELSRTVLKERGVHPLPTLSAPRDVGSINNVNRHVCTGNSTPRAVVTLTPRAGVERIRLRLKRVLSEKMIELDEPGKIKEQMIKLKEIYEQLNMIESNMRPSSSQETPRNDHSLDSVMGMALVSI